MFIRAGSNLTKQSVAQYTFLLLLQNDLFFLFLFYKSFFQDHLEDEIL